jgi:hypothetical protein
MFNRPALLMVAAMLTLPAATTQAADAEPGPWSAPVHVSRAPGVYDFWFSSAGNGVVVSLCCGGFGPGVPGTRLALSDTDGRFGPSKVLSHAIGAQLVAGSPGHIRVVGWIKGPEHSTDTGVADLVHGKLTKPYRVLPVRVAGTAQARNARGDIAILGHVSRRSPKRSTHDRLYLTVGRAGHRFSSPRRLTGTGGPAGLGVGINTRGDVVAAWVRDGVIYARERRRNGRFGRRVRVARDAIAENPRVAVAADGRVAIAWTSQEPSGEDIPRTAASMRVVLRDRGKSFGKPILLERNSRPRAYGSIPSESVRAAALPNGSIKLIWVGEEQDKTVIRAAQTAGATIGATQTLSDPTRDAAQPQVAVGSGGDTAVAWSDLDDQASTVDLEAALQPAGATAFGPREQIAPGRPFGAGVAIAINPVGGRVVAAWEERPGGVFTASRASARN